MKTLTHLISIRESAAKSLSGGIEESHFTKLAQKTLTRPEVRDLAGAKEILALAYQIVAKDSTLVLASLNAETIRKESGEIIGHLVIVDDVGYFLGVTSASKPDISIIENQVTMTNAYTQMLGKLVVKYKVKNLHSANFDRLVRMRAVAADIKNSLIYAKCVLNIDGREIKAWEDNGGMEYDLYAQMSEMDVKSTIRRLTNGAHGLLVDNRWPMAEQQIPGIGYKFAGPRDKRVVADANMHQLIKDFITWTADSSISYTEIAQRLADKHKFVSNTARTRGASLITDSKTPDLMVKNMLRIYLPIWLSNKYVYSAWVPYFMNQTQNLRTDAQETVTTHARKSIGAGVDCEAVNFTLTFDASTLPNQSWAPRELIVKAIARVAKESAYDARILKEKLMSIGESAVFNSIPKGQIPVIKNSYNDEARRPLLGLPEWTNAGRRYVLGGERTISYYVLSTDDSSPDRSWYNRAQNDAAKVEGVISTKTLHSKLADAIIEKLATGVEWGTASDKVNGQNIDAKQSEDLRKKIDALTTTLTDYEDDLKIARANKLSDTIQHRLIAIEKIRSEIKTASEQVAYNQTVNNTDALQADTVAYVESIALSLAALHKTQSTGEAVLNTFIRRLIHNIQVTPKGTTLEVSVNVNLPTSQGTIVCGPITFEVKNVQRTVDNLKAKAERCTRLVFQENYTVEQARIAVGYKKKSQTPRVIADLLREHNIFLNSNRLAAIITSPIRDAKLVIWHLIQSKVNSTPFVYPPGLDKKYVDHIVQTYTSADGCANNWNTINTAKVLQAILEELNTKDTFTCEELVKTVSKFSKNIDKSTRYLAAQLTQGMRLPASMQNTQTRIPLLKEVPRQKVYSTYETRTCKHCKTKSMTTVVLAPELSQSNLLCTTCRRAENMPKVVFPESYLAY